VPEAWHNLAINTLREELLDRFGDLSVEIEVPNNISITLLTREGKKG